METKLELDEDSSILITIDLSADIAMTPEEFWVDEKVPDNFDAQDVIESMKLSCRDRKARLIEDWTLADLNDARIEVRVRRKNPAFLGNYGLFEEHIPPEYLITNEVW
jgi:hypothetical protein